jgi:hypothetical protein
MHFRATVRDGDGGVAWDSTTIRTTSSAFRVTSPAAGARWRKSTQQTVTWDVENPKISNNVRILIHDGTNWISLKENTPNDGVEPITVPNITTGNAKILVGALGSVFFSMSAGSLTVAGTGSSTVVSQGFETGYPGWEKLHVNGSNWYRDNKNAHNGSWRFAVGGGDYIGGTNTSLATPWFSVAGRTSVTMTFYAKYQTEPTADNLIVYAQVLGGPTGIPVGKWSGESSGWPGWAPQFSVDASAAIAQAAGKPIRLVFGFKSDASVSGWGAALDDVKVTVQ